MGMCQMIEFAFRSASRRLYVGYGRNQMPLTGHRGVCEPPNSALGEPGPGTRGPARRSGRTLELEEVQPAAGAVHGVHDAVGGHVDVVDLGRADARAR